MTLIHEYSRGLPRTISVMCGNALMSGFALAQRPVDRDIVLEICRDFDLGGTATLRLQNPHLALVTSDATTADTAGGPALTDGSNARQHRDATEPRGSSMLGLR